MLKAENLPAAEYSLMHAEMLWGHRVVAGDEDVLASMPPMPFAGLGLAEFTRLMLNRGSLLLMNRRALLTGATAEAAGREQFMKYLFKAVLACGDARLAAADHYHPAYTEKWQRLQQLQHPRARNRPPRFRHRPLRRRPRSVARPWRPGSRSARLH